MQILVRASVLRYLPRLARACRFTTSARPLCRIGLNQPITYGFRRFGGRDPPVAFTKLTERGGEGVVVKPLSFVVRGQRGLAQPAVKCRGPEYLRIIYGPEYTTDEIVSRLRTRGLGHKRSLALGEFALGVEGLERFVRREPLRRVHECVFGVLALESEPVDPRL